MAEQVISQEEVWDDSGLVDSWNEAFEEYKKYHSLAAKGQKVNIAAERAAKGLTNGDPLPHAMNDTDVLDQPEQPTSETHAGAPSSRGAQPELVPPPISAAAVTMPQALMATVQNEDLKNLMMSWYYAGYYTGLYEGKQQGYALAQQPQGG